MSELHRHKSSSSASSPFCSCKHGARGRIARRGRPLGPGSLKEARAEEGVGGPGLHWALCVSLGVRMKERQRRWCWEGTGRHRKCSGLRGHFCFKGAGSMTSSISISTQQHLGNGIRRSEFSGERK